MHPPSPDDSTARDTRRTVWTRYWATGTPHSCGGSYGDTYGGSLAAFWREAFGPLADGDRVLDVATGNGALPRLLLQLQPPRAVEVDAVDLARIAPDWLRDALPDVRARVRFHGDVPAESLPFADRSFELVASQYGIEYTDLARSVPEVLRVLAPGGRVRLVVHHAHARPVVLARDEIDHIDWLTRPAGTFDVAMRMLEPMAQSGTEAGRAALAIDAAANAARRDFNAAQEAVSQRIAASRCPDVLHDVRGWIGQAFGVATAQGAEAAGRTLDAARQMLADARTRLQELRDCALDDAGAQALCERLAGAGTRVERMPLHDAGHLLGWAVRADLRS